MHRHGQDTVQAQTSLSQSSWSRQPSQAQSSITLSACLDDRAPSELQDHAWYCWSVRQLILVLPQLADR